MGVFLDVIRFFLNGGAKGNTSDVTARVSSMADRSRQNLVSIHEVLPADVIESLQMVLPAAAFARFEQGMPASFLERFDNGLPPEMMKGLQGMMPAEKIARLNQSLIDHARQRAGGGASPMPTQTVQPESAQSDLGVPGATIPEVNSWESEASIPQANPWVPDAKITGDDPWHPGQSKPDDPWNPGATRKSNDPWHPG